LSTNAGAEQGGGLPPVTDEDIKAPVVDQGSEVDPKAPKTDKQQSPSQPKDAPAPKDGQDAPDAKEKGSGPWDAELAKRGIADPNVDAFLREVVQPYVTKLEQGGDGSPIAELFGGDQEQAEAAQELLQSFIDDPETAYRELGELLGLSTPGMGSEDDLAGLDPEGDPGAGDPASDGNESLDPRLDYVDQMMQREREQAEDAEYENMLSQLGERLPGFDSELFTQFVVSSGGDMDRAMQIYMKYHRPPDPADNPPPTVDGGTPPPAAPNHSSIGDAIGSWMAEDSAANPKR